MNSQHSNLKTIVDKTWEEYLDTIKTGNDHAVEAVSKTYDAVFENWIRSLELTAKAKGA